MLGVYEYSYRSHDSTLAGENYTAGMDTEIVIKQIGVVFTFRLGAQNMTSLVFFSRERL